MIYHFKGSLQEKNGIFHAVGGFEKVILFNRAKIAKINNEKIALIGPKKGQTFNFIVVSILLSRTSPCQIFNIIGYILICEPKFKSKVLNIPLFACCLNG